MDIDKIRTAADTLFNTSAFLQLAVPADVCAASQAITVDADTIPVVSEETTATAKTLVFNTLDSCLGLIAVHPDGQLTGVHLASLEYLGKKMSDQADAAIAAMPAGCRLFSVGDNQAAWGAKANDLPRISGDHNQRSWAFQVEGDQLKSYCWIPKKTSDLGAQPISSSDTAVSSGKATS